MSGIGHTPGPWFVREIRGLSEICEVIAPDDWVVAPTVRLRDARLIAAAPGMLAAVLEWRKADAANRVGLSEDQIARLYREAYRLRVAAIVKATSQ